MPVATQLALWGAALYGVLALNILTKRDADTVGSAGMLLAGWCVSRVLGAFYDVPDSMRLYPVLDAFCAVVVFCTFVSRPAWWKLVLISLFTLQLCLHTAFWSAWNQGRHDALTFYREVNNGTLALELLVVSWGAIMDGAGHVVRHMSRWGGSVHLHRVDP